MDPNLYEALKAGLSQIPRKGLERLRAYIAADLPLLLTGNVWHPGKGG